MAVLNLEPCGALHMSGNATPAGNKRQSRHAKSLQQHLAKIDHSTKIDFVIVLSLYLGVFIILIEA